MKREKTTEKRKPLAVVVEPVVLHPTRTFETRCFWCGRANRVTQYEYGKAEGLKIGQETRNYCPACKKNTRHYVGVFMQNLRVWGRPTRTKERTMANEPTTEASNPPSDATTCGSYPAAVCSAIAEMPNGLPDKFDIIIGNREAYDAHPAAVKENDARLRALIRKANNAGYRVIVWYSEGELRTYYSFSKLNPVVRGATESRTSPPRCSTGG